MIPHRADEPFSDQLEWLEHRYDPGHFLGGTLRPELRLSLGSQAKKTAALLAIVPGIAAVGLGTLMAAAIGLALVPLGWITAGTLNVLVGRRLWMSAGREGLPGMGEAATRVLRLLGMVGLAIAVAVCSAVAALALLGALTAAFRGDMAIAAGLAVLLAAVVFRAEERR